MSTIAVLGDVHGNARALRAALAQAHKGPFDRMVFLGDLLTYGHDVDEVLDLVAEAQEKDSATLLWGTTTACISTWPKGVVTISTDYPIG